MHALISFVLKREQNINVVIVSVVSFFFIIIYYFIFSVLFVEYPPAWATSQNGRSRSTHRANPIENTTQKGVNQFVYLLTRVLVSFFSTTVTQDPAGIFELVEVVGNGTYGQVYKVRWWCCE